jgi:hypothetical protein
MIRFASLLAATALVSAGAAYAAEPEPAHLDLKGGIAPDGWFKADATFTLPPQEVGRETAFLISDRFGVESASVDQGGVIRTEPTDKPLDGLNKIIIRFPQAPAQPVTLRLRYQGPLVAKDAGPSDGLELRLENMWIPARADLNLRFTSRAEIDGLPEDRVVVAQGDIRHVGDKVTVVRDVPDMDLPFVAVKGLKKLTAPDVEIYAMDLDSRLIKIFAKHAPAAVAYHEAHFGPIPGGGPVRIAVHERPGSGYARRGFISSTDPKAEASSQPDFPEINPAAFMAHEFAHAWWSAADPLTENYWLVESLAEYSSMRYVEHAFGKAELDKALERKQARAKDAGPILGGKRPTRDALYAKGCLLLFELEGRIGREAMDKVLARLGRKPPRLTAEFMAVLTEVAGADAARVFEARLRA